MADLPINWVDDIGMEVDADYLNELGDAVNKGSKMVFTQTAYDAIAVKETGRIYVVIPG